MRDGEQRWSARSLVGPMGYSRWERFAAVVAKAMASTEAQNLDVATHFKTFQEPGEIGRRGPVAVDYLLTREAAYLVAMNGDVRKPEIAAAQGYFVDRTIQAETAERALATVGFEGGLPEQMAALGAEMDRLVSLVDLQAQAITVLTEQATRAIEWAEHASREAGRAVEVVDEALQSRWDAQDYAARVALAAKTAEMALATARHAATQAEEARREGRAAASKASRGSGAPAAIQAPSEPVLTCSQWADRRGIRDRSAATMETLRRRATAIARERRVVIEQRPARGGYTANAYPLSILEEAAEVIRRQRARAIEAAEALPTL